MQKMIEALTSMFMTVGVVYSAGVDFCVDARAVYDAIRASDACELAGSSFKLHFISARDRMTHGLLRNLFWVDTRDMLADGSIKGGIGRTLLHRCSNDCKYVSTHESLMHNKAFGRSGTNQQEPLAEESAELTPGP